MVNFKLGEEMLRHADYFEFTFNNMICCWFHDRLHYPKLAVNFLHPLDVFTFIESHRALKAYN